MKKLTLVLAAIFAFIQIGPISTVYAGAAGSKPSAASSDAAASIVNKFYEKIHTQYEERALSDESDSPQIARDNSMGNKISAINLSNILTTLQRSQASIPMDSPVYKSFEFVTSFVNSQLDNAVAGHALKMGGLPDMLIALETVIQKNKSPGIDSEALHTTVKNLQSFYKAGIAQIPSGSIIEKIARLDNMALELPAEKESSPEMYAYGQYLEDIRTGLIAKLSKISDSDISSRASSTSVVDELSMLVKQFEVAEEKHQVIPSAKIILNYSNLRVLAKKLNVTASDHGSKLLNILAPSPVVVDKPSESLPMELYTPAEKDLEAALKSLNQSKEDEAASKKIELLTTLQKDLERVKKINSFYGGNVIAAKSYLGVVSALSLQVAEGKPLDKNMEDAFSALHFLTLHISNNDKTYMTSPALKAAKNAITNMNHPESESTDDDERSPSHPRNETVGIGGDDTGDGSFYNDPDSGHDSNGHDSNPVLDGRPSRLPTSSAPDEYLSDER
jgi:hypothetical protein